MQVNFLLNYHLFILLINLMRKDKTDFCNESQRICYHHHNNHHRFISLVLGNKFQVENTVKNLLWRYENKCCYKTLKYLQIKKYVIPFYYLPLSLSLLLSFSPSPSHSLSFSISLSLSLPTCKLSMPSVDSIELLNSLSC